MENFSKSEDIVVFSPNFDEICRTCTKLKSESLHQIFNSEIFNTENPISTSEMLFAVSTLKMLPDDDLPKGICIQCLESLKKAYHFQKMCILSDLTMRNLQLSYRDDKSSLVFDQDASKNRVNILISGTRPKLIEPLTHCDEKCLKNVETCDDIKRTVYFEQRKNVKRESDSNSDTSNKDDPDHTKIIHCEKKEENLTLKEQTFPKTIKTEIENPNPRNKRKAFFTCDDCGKSFDRQHRLQRHMSVHKREGRPFECVDCKRRFAQEGQLRRHAITHDKNFLEQSELNKIIDGHQCPECPRKFLKQVSLASHMRTHRKEIDNCKPYQCEECQKMFEGIHRLNRHKKLHEENHKYICDTCGQTFGFRSHLIDHLSKHSGIKPHICHYCKKSFQQAGTLKDHLRTHTGEQPFLCSECGKAFKSASNLRQHQLRHKGVKSYHCSECPSKFALKSDLSKHLSTHGNEKPYTCDICGSRFTKNYSLKKHKIIHTGEKPYKCDCCEMRFSSSNHMKRHMRTHTGEKPYACKYCDRKFAQSNDLIKHLRSHVGENVYKCKECDASFRLNTELKKHIAEHYQAQMKKNASESN